MSAPEELARQNIDALLTQCGWTIQKRFGNQLSATRDRLGEGRIQEWEIADARMYFQLQNSPALSLLHKRHAGVLLSFFPKGFQGGKRLEIPEERLEGRWETFIEEDVVLSDWEEETPTNTAKFYLEEWCKNRWLARNYDEKEGTYVYRLTAHTDQALLFVEQHLTANRRAFIGTESNFSKSGIPLSSWLRRLRPIRWFVNSSFSLSATRSTLS